MNENTKQIRKDWKFSNRRSYLLRLWHADGPGGNWQASLEIPETGERIGFASLEELFTYLMDLTTAYEQHVRREYDHEQNELRKQDIG